MRRVRNPTSPQIYFLYALLISLLPSASPGPFTPTPHLLRRFLRDHIPSRQSTPISITFTKPKPSVPQLSPLELAIDSTFGFVASEEASEAACQRIPGLSNHQRNLCRSNPGLIWALVDGIQLGLYECVHQFKYDRWNCSMARVVLGKPRGEAFLLNGDKSSAANLIGSLQKTLMKSTRETAFVTAAWAAGAVQAVTRACSRGRISTCDCDVTRRGGLKAADTEGPFTWGGCSDPIRFGMRLVRLFQEPRLPASKNKNRKKKRRSKHNLNGAENDTIIDVDDSRILMDIHNQKVGRRFVWQSCEKKCKCHGVSGACSLRTCWQRTGPFRGVGDLLKKAYLTSLQVAFDTSTRQLIRQADPLFFGGMPLPPGHLTKRSANWFIAGGGEKTTPWQRIKRESEFGENWIKKQKDKLVFLDYSPDYCKVDSRIGHLGVTGRQCEVDKPNSPNSCNKICCGRGYDIFEVDTKEKCNCKFVWCCEVKCSVCHRKSRIYRCKPEIATLTRRIDSILNGSVANLWAGQRRKAYYANYR